MIPKIVSFYWGGGSLSYLQYLSIVSFKKHNPDWKINLFMPDREYDIEPSWRTTEHTYDYKGKDYTGEAIALCDLKLVNFKEMGADGLHAVQKSDLIRWKILYDYGGVWSDIDIFYIKPMIKIRGDVGWVYDGIHHIIGFYITKPKQKIFLDIYEDAKDIVRRNSADHYQSIGNELLKNKFMNFKAVKNSYPDIKVVNLPMEVVYPYRPNSDIYEMFFEYEDKTTEKTIGIHWYNGNFVAKEYQNNINKYLNNTSKMSSLVRELECSQ